MRVERTEKCSRPQRVFVLDFDLHFVFKGNHEKGPVTETGRCLERREIKK